MSPLCHYERLHCGNFLSCFDEIDAIASVDFAVALLFVTFALFLQMNPLLAESADFSQYIAKSLSGGSVGLKERPQRKKSSGDEQQGFSVTHSWRAHLNQSSSSGASGKIVVDLPRTQARTWATDYCREDTSEGYVRDFDDDEADGDGKWSALLQTKQADSIKQNHRALSSTLLEQSPPRHPQLSPARVAGRSPASHSFAGMAKVPSATSPSSKSRILMINPEEKYRYTLLRRCYRRWRLEARLRFGVHYVREKRVKNNSTNFLIESSFHRWKSHWGAVCFAKVSWVPPLSYPLIAG